VGTALHRPTALEHHDLVGVADGAEAVRDDQARASAPSDGTDARA
jgi:hypothetical protein